MRVGDITARSQRDRYARVCGKFATAAPPLPASMDGTEHETWLRDQQWNNTTEIQLGSQFATAALRPLCELNSWPSNQFFKFP
jgi:hypothetical protein